MEAEPRPEEDVSGDWETPMPGDEPTEDIAGAPRHVPVAEFFSRRAFLSKDTGRWHRLPGGRDRKQDQPK